MSGPLLLRAVLVLVALWLWVRLLPGLPDAAALVGLVALGALVALPGAWAGAVRRGHGLGVLTAGGRLRGLLAGPGLRLVMAGGAGLVAAALLGLRLVGAGVGLWVLAVLPLPLTWGLMALLQPRIRAEAAGLHARRLTHLWARRGAVGVMLVAALTLALWAPPAPPEPATGPSAAGPLVTEALALARLWAGLEAFALGQAAEFGAWGRGLAALVGISALAAVFWALATLAVALTLSHGEAWRALAPASDTCPPPPVGRRGPAVALGLAGLVLLAGVWGGWALDRVAADDRPAARLEVTGEWIGDALHTAGTTERLADLRAAVLAEDTEARATLVVALNAGFDAMAGNVERFLDDYYSLWGEYGRLLRWAMGRLEAHMAAELTAALQAGDPFAAYTRQLEAAIAGAEARAARLAWDEAALLDGSRLEGINPARLRVVARHPVPMPLPAARLAQDLQSAQERWIVSAGTGTVAIVLAQRVAARLASRGVLAVAARMVARVGGLLLAFGLDYALVKLDELQNRDDFRAEILAEIEALRATALEALGAVQR